MKTFFAFGLAVCLLLVSCSKEVPHRIQKRCFFAKWKFVTVTKNYGNTEVHDHDGAEIRLNKDYTAGYFDVNKNLSMQGTWQVSYSRKQFIKTRENWDCYHLIIDLSSPDNTRQLHINSNKTWLSRAVPYDNLTVLDGEWYYYFLQTFD